MEIKVYTEHYGQVDVFPALSLYDAMDIAREFVDLGAIVEVSINGIFFRILRDGNILRSIPQPQDSSPSSVRNPNLSTNGNQGGPIA